MTKTDEEVQAMGGEEFVQFADTLRKMSVQAGPWKTEFLESFLSAKEVHGVACPFERGVSVYRSNTTHELFTVEEAWK
ncbi:MAG: hypothetical protein V4474_04385 [Patescibacteria group bacterium]